MTVAEITARMEQVRKNLHTNEIKLNDLRVKRGQLSIENAEENKIIITRLDKQIENVRRDIENAPTEVRLLEEQLTAELAKVSQAAKDSLLSQQKSCVGQMEAISKKLVDALEIANDWNLQLVVVATRYCSLQKQTGQDITMGATCRPSEQLLQVVYETLKGELEGQPQNARCQGQPPYVRI